jgi:hypothetical protein
LWAVVSIQARVNDASKGIDAPYCRFHLINVTSTDEINLVEQHDVRKRNLVDKLLDFDGTCFCGNVLALEVHSIDDGAAELRVRL